MKNKFILYNAFAKLTRTENALIFENKTTGNTAVLTGGEEFTLYLGKENTKPVSSQCMALLDVVLEDGKGTLTYAYEGLKVQVVYTAQSQTFTKKLVVTSHAPVYIKRVALETHISSLEVARGGEGQPAFLGNEVFCGIEYPVANNHYEGKELYFTQAPFGEYTQFESLPVVFGINVNGNLLRSFEGYIRSKMMPKQKMRIYCDWGSHDDGDDVIFLTEELVLENIRRLADIKARSGVKMDYYLMDAYWWDLDHPYEEFKPSTFPEGDKNVRAALEENGLKFGIWFDLSCVYAKYKDKDEYSTLLNNGSLCFDCEEVVAIMKNAILKRIRESGIEMVKLDFAYFECLNAKHGHSVDVLESKERSVKNFLAMLEEIKAVEPDFKVLCYNGWTTDLQWIVSGEKKEGYAISPYWCFHVDYLYCGDPRPSETPTASFADSVIHYTDCMIKNFLASGIPMAAIDDHGTMMGYTHTVYRMGKTGYRKSILLDVMREAKLNLYGDLSLDDEDACYLAFVDGIYNELYDNGYAAAMIGGDPRKKECYGYSLCGAEGGYAVLLNPTSKTVYAPLFLQEWQGCNVKVNVCIRDGELVEEEPIYTEGDMRVTLSPNGFVLVRWSRASEKTANSVIFSAGDELVLNTENKRSLTVRFTKDGKGIRTATGYPDGFSIEGDMPLKLERNDTVWSGVSWLHFTLDGQREVRLAYRGKDAIRVKYILEE